MLFGRRKSRESRGPKTVLSNFSCVLSNSLCIGSCCVRIVAFWCIRLERISIFYCVSQTGSLFAFIAARVPAVKSNRVLILVCSANPEASSVLLITSTSRDSSWAVLNKLVRDLIQTLGIIRKKRHHFAFKPSKWTRVSTHLTKMSKYFFSVSISQFFSKNFTTIFWLIFQGSLVKH